MKVVLAQGGPLDPARAVDVVRQVATAIDDAHAQQAVHRAVAADTILLAGDGSVYLTDIGGAKPSVDRTRVLITNTEATYRADIRALAAVLYECLTGHPPDSAAPAPPSRQRTGVPAALDAVVARGMAESDDPYRSAAELASAAQGALAPPPTPPSAAATRTFQLPAPAVAMKHQPPQWNPPHSHSPTVSYPHSRPVPMPLPPPPPPRRRRIAPVIAAVAIIGTVVAGAIAIPRITHHHRSVAPTTSTAPARRTFTAHPTELPFPGLHPTRSIAVDGAGIVYVLAAVVAPADAGLFETEPTKLWKLAPGATAATQLDIPGVDFRMATDLAADKGGNLYYSIGAQVYLLESGKASPIRLPFRGFSSVRAVAVDDAGNTYATGAVMGGDLTVMYGAKKLAPGENRPTDLPFSNLFLPRGIAVDKDGNVYVSSSIKNTGHGQVLKLPAGAAAATALAIPGLIEPNDIAFDNVGDVFVGDGFGKGFFQLPAGGNPVEVPLGAHSDGLAVDSAGVVYVLTSAKSDRSDRIVKPGQVLKIPPDR